MRGEVRAQKPITKRMRSSRPGSCAGSAPADRTPKLWAFVRSRWRPATNPGKVREKVREEFHAEAESKAELKAGPTAGALAVASARPPGLTLAARCSAVRLSAG